MVRKNIRVFWEIMLVLKNSWEMEQQQYGVNQQDLKYFWCLYLGRCIGGLLSNVGGCFR